MVQKCNTPEELETQSARALALIDFIITSCEGEVVEALDIFGVLEGLGKWRVSGLVDRDLYERLYAKMREVE